MQNSWIIGLIGALLLVGCKPTQPTATTVSDFKDDFVPYRLAIHESMRTTATPQVKPNNTPQSLPSTNTTPSTNKKVVINQPPVNPASAVTATANTRLEQIARRNLEINKMQGFRIQLYAGNNRSEAERIFSKIRISYESDLHYEQPNYKVKVGNYLNRLDAHKELVKLQTEFPQAIIIPDLVKINLEQY